MKPSSFGGRRLRDWDVFGKHKDVRLAAQARLQFPKVQEAGARELPTQALIQGEAFNDIRHAIHVP